LPPCPHRAAAPCDVSGGLRLSRAELDPQKFVVNGQRPATSDWPALSFQGGSRMQSTFEALYDDLRRLARSEVRRHQTITLLNTTSLVHESYLRVLKSGQVRTDERGEFMAYMARVMRSVVVDFVRSRMAEKRGGKSEHVPMDTELEEKISAHDADVLRVHEALDVLAQSDARMAQVVEMRYFAGLEDAEIAQALRVSERTVRRDWEKARLLLAVAFK
jgi:RNA polymerase sigma factor (TIGR02999 family)